MQIFNILLLTLFLMLMCWLWSRRRYYRIWLKIPGPLGLPFIGVVLQLFKPDKFMHFFERLANTYKSPCITWLGTNCHLYINDPETIETVFTSPACISKAYMYSIIESAIGDGLFTSSPPRWNRHRRLLNPAFNRKIVESFIPIFNQKSNILVKELRRSQGQALELFEILKKSVFEVVFETTIGSGMDLNHVKGKELFDSYTSILELLVTRMVTPWLHPTLIYRLTGQLKRQQQYLKVISHFVNIFAKNILKGHKESPMASSETVDTAGKDGYELNTAKENPFVECLRIHLQKGQLSFEDINCESNVIISGSFETISTTVYFVCLCLAMHPECQDKLYKELMEVFPAQGTLTDLDDVTADHLPQMPYTTMVINEAMRLFAPVPMVCRNASSDFTLRNGIVIPRGTQLSIDIFNMQRNEQIWGSHARTFDPERHFGASNSLPHPYAFIPFTKGIRMCIGYPYALLHMKILVAKIFRNFRVHSDVKMADLQVKGTISLKLAHYPLCTFEARTN